VTPEINDLAAKAGVQWFDYQVEALEYVQGGNSAEAAPLRLCLYYKTGAGKSVTGLACMYLDGARQVLVLAPPSTHGTWEQWGRKLGIDVECISHAKFRQPGYKVSRSQAIIVDEFHLLGGHKGKGWKKLDRLAASLQAPLILMSATPNYNDAERVYCIQHVLDPHSVKGGYLAFLYAHCTTEQNPFGQEPIVTGFLRYANAAEYLSALPQVLYLPDDLVYTIDEVTLAAADLPHMDRYGYDERRHKMIGSLIEERHARVYQSLVNEDGWIHDHVYDVLEGMAGYATTPLLVYANHATVAEAVALSLATNGVRYRIVTGKSSTKDKAACIQQFIAGDVDVLVGTASLATGTDGMDKVCDWLVILDDTDDASLRRQLIGRIMPRGEGGDASTKHVIRLNLQ
jgi:superfamily II DNA or RNA helicase